MNFPETVQLIDGQAITPAPALVVLVSANEAEGVFTITDVSIRVPAGYSMLPPQGEIRVLSGPLAGVYSVTQTRGNRHHTRYIVSRTV